jgi:Na+-driven multidrug efflux pump
MLMSDSIIAGAVLGSDAVAGVTLVTPIYSFSPFSAPSSPSEYPSCTQRRWENSTRRARNQAFGFGLLMAIIVGVVLFAATSVFGELYLRSNNPPESVFAQARIICSGCDSPFL